MNHPEDSFDKENQKKYSIYHHITT